eukprot:6207886-Pleurochrysis_carterae.AAC.2
MSFSCASAESLAYLLFSACALERASQHGRQSAELGRIKEPKGRGGCGLMNPCKGQSPGCKPPVRVAMCAKIALPKMQAYTRGRTRGVLEVRMLSDSRSCVRTWSLLMVRDCCCDAERYAAISVCGHRKYDSLFNTQQEYADQATHNMILALSVESVRH